MLKSNFAVRRLCPLLCQRHINSQTKKPNIVVVGAGWAGYRCAAELDKKKFDVSVVSPRNHFLFTPLLPSTAVGTVEFRAIQEPIRSIPGIKYYQAEVKSIDFKTGTLQCEDAFKKDQHHFEFPYDGLILCPGSETHTYGVPGVEGNEFVFYLKQLQQARSIRNRLIDSFERASSPGASPEEVQRLLTFVVVGGGPTSVEFTAELHDFLKGDVSRLYPDLHPLCNVYIVEASGHILGAFNQSLVSYVESLFKSRKIHVMTNTQVSAVEGSRAVLSSGKQLDFGLMVWSTGIRQIPLIRGLSTDQVRKSRSGRLEVDPCLRLLKPSKNHTAGEAVSSGSSKVLVGQDSTISKPVFALGDCAGDSAKPLPALAQVAAQQAVYIAHALNRHGLDKMSSEGTSPFAYKSLGSMASVGQWKGVYDSTSSDSQAPSIKGFLAFVLWRSAYWTKSVSLTNKLLIAMYWFKTALFGRDISRF